MTNTTPFKLRPARVPYTHYLVIEDLIVPGLDVHQVRGYLYDLCKAFDCEQYDYQDGDFYLKLDWSKFRGNVTTEQALWYISQDYPDDWTADEIDAAIENVENATEAVHDDLDPDTFAFAVCMVAAMDASTKEIVDLMNNNKLAIFVDH